MSNCENRYLTSPGTGLFLDNPKYVDQEDRKQDQKPPEERISYCMPLIKKLKPLGIWLRVSKRG